MEYRRCGYCGGSGKVECDCTGGCGPSAANDSCPACGGSGEVKESDY